MNNDNPETVMDEGVLVPVVELDRLRAIASAAERLASGSIGAAMLAEAELRRLLS